MKKPTDRFLTWLRIHSRNSMRRRLRTRAKSYSPGRFSRGEIRLRAPARLCLSTNYDDVLRLINKIVEFVGKTKTYVDFKPILTVSPDAALLLAATLDMWQRHRNVTLRTREIEKWSPQVTHIFRNLGLFDLLKTPGLPCVAEASVSQIEILKLCSGQRADGSLAHQLTTSLKGMVSTIEEEPLYVGLTEAMTNSAQHAYTLPDYGIIPEDWKRWWMTGSYDRQIGSLRILILDLGNGIPATLKLSTLWDQISSYLSRLSAPNDADRIDAAVQAGRSSTGNQGRGNGLDEIRKFIEQGPNGRLRILSGEGEVVYSSGDENPAKFVRALPFPGTLIEWEIRI